MVFIYRPKFYKIIYIILALALFPFVIFSLNSGMTNYIVPPFLLSLVFYSNELFFLFLRHAQKKYEEILYRSFLERIKSVIQIILFSSFFISGIYFVLAKDPIPFIITAAAFVFWLIIQRLTVSIGDKNIIIGKERFAYAEIDNIKLEKRNIIIEYDNTYKKYRYRISEKDKNQVEKLFKKLL